MKDRDGKDWKKSEYYDSHLHSKQRKDSSERVSQQAVRGSRAGTIQRTICINEVQDASTEYEEIADAEGDGSQNRHNPMDIGPG